MQICVLAQAGGEQVMSSRSVICPCWTLEKQKVLRGKTEALFSMPHSPSVAHQTPIDSLERHCSQKKEKETKEQMSHLFPAKRQPGSAGTHVALQTYHQLITFSHTATRLMASLNDTDVPPRAIPRVEIKKEG